MFNTLFCIYRYDELREIVSCSLLLIVYSAVAAVVVSECCDISYGQV